MLKFIVVLVKRDDMTNEEFARYLREVHGPIAERIPGLRRYVQNHPAEDPNRPPPKWNAVIELYFDDWEAMEAAWASPEGRASTADLENFADLSRSTWSVVDEQVRRS
jgi:uncharacterized protein (TIGR02118 family)